MIGKTLGHYRVGEQLGRGGMGEVYVADDLNLNRKVALKFLPDAFTGDPERMARFEREAKVLASLNHSNIAAIYGLEQAEGKRFLVLELVEGETLAQRISKRALSVDDALGICRQIAEGLEAAHEKGVIHRDLKPANVMITEGDKVKILDFGLAKALSDETQSIDSSQSPTLTEAMTRPGVILGTAAYMSPEQAKGKAVDKRADIWAFGCILYECLTGRRAFEGETVTETLAAILKGEPDWKALQASSAPNIRFVLRRCLEKDLSRRFHHAADLRIEIEEAGSPDRSTEPPDTAVSTQTGWRRRVPLGTAILIAGIMAVIAGVWGWILRSSNPASAPLSVARFSMTLPSTDRLAQWWEPSIAVSPDGKQIVYVGSRGAIIQLFLRHTDSLEIIPIPGTEGAFSPFFSPDGQWIGFFATNKLKKVSVRGGSVQSLCDVPLGFGGSWGADNTIYFAPFNISGLSMVSASGGTPQELTRLNRSKGEVSHRWPQILPGGKAMLFTLWTGPGWGERQIVLYLLQSREQRVLVQGGDTARYVSTGHIVYCHAGQLMAVPFDLAGLKTTGTPVPLDETVLNYSDGANYAVSEAGSLFYIPTSEQSGNRQLVWVGRDGIAVPLDAPPRYYQGVCLSPNGRQIATTVWGETSGVWILDLARSTLSLVSSEGGSNQWPIWTQDGKRIIYRGTRKGFRNLFWKAADGSGAEERLTTGESSEVAYSCSPDGKLLVYGNTTEKTAADIWMMNLEGEHKPQALLKSVFNEREGVVSPDGRWLAYWSDESGRAEIYAQPFPGPGAKLQVSKDGGTQPVWNLNGRELFYQDGNKMMSVSINTHPSFTIGSPRVLFEARYIVGLGDVKGYDVSSDGQRFLMIKGTEEEHSPTQIRVVLNWTEELKQRVRVK